MRKFLYSSFRNYSFINISKQIQLPKNFQTNQNDLQGFEYRLYLSDGNEIISFWHDLNLKNLDNTYKMVVEVSKDQRAKYEMAKDEIDNPIRHDYVVKDEQHILKFFGINTIFNSGYFPQTWENPRVNSIDEYLGDDDPLDAIEVGNTVFNTGQIIDVYIIGAFCVIDNLEGDWKIVCMNRFDFENKFQFSNFDALMEWFKNYQIKKKGNTVKSIYNSNQLFSKKDAENLIVKSHKSYIDLRDKKVAGLEYKNYNFDI